MPFLLILLPTVAYLVAGALSAFVAADFAVEYFA